MVKRYAAMVAVLFVVLALVWGWMFWEKSQRDQADAFARPLQEHPLPAGMSLVVADADKGEDGSTIGALLLRGTTDEESLLAFYSDTDYPPAKEGETVTLEVREADDSSLDALRQANLYEEGADYWFVYVTSAPAA
ncbi:hypothetical protein H6B33_02345 [Gemmiger formicilis]|uniref:hypothetical protein n=1 Tax=Gemmiger formicilis TaxID=745368 RepID=UPI001958045D|nr:hypothetical protein [Gemmiger formicilis]MBM6914244.1 hypothetical protein [Gemmiger formicilis]